MGDIYAYRSNALKIYSDKTQTAKAYSTTFDDTGVSLVTAESGLTTTSTTGDLKLLASAGKLYATSQHNMYLKASSGELEAVSAGNLSLKSDYASVLVEGQGVVSLKSNNGGITLNSSSNTTVSSTNDISLTSTNTNLTNTNITLTNTNTNITNTNTHVKSNTLFEVETENLTLKSTALTSTSSTVSLRSSDRIDVVSNTDLYTCGVNSLSLSSLSGPITVTANANLSLSSNGGVVSLNSNNGVKLNNNLGNIELNSNYSGITAFAKTDVSLTSNNGNILVSGTTYRNPENISKETEIRKPITDLVYEINNLKYAIFNVNGITTEKIDKIKQLLEGYDDRSNENLWQIVLLNKSILDNLTARFNSVFEQTLYDDAIPSNMVVGFYNSFMYTYINHDINSKHPAYSSNYGTAWVFEKSESEYINWALSNFRNPLEFSDFQTIKFDLEITGRNDNGTFVFSKLPFCRVECGTSIDFTVSDSENTAFQNAMNESTYKNSVMNSLKEEGFKITLVVNLNNTTVDHSKNEFLLSSTQPFPNDIVSKICLRTLTANEYTFGLNKYNFKTNLRNQFFTYCSEK